MKNIGFNTVQLMTYWRDWEQVVDNDTNAIIQHSKDVGVFFHKSLKSMKAKILFTGSRKDEFVSAISPDYFNEVYSDMIKKIGHGDIHLFNEGGHPAMLTNPIEFYDLSMSFLIK